MATLSHHLEYLAARTGMAVAESLSARAADRLGVGLGFIVHRVLASRRRIAFVNIKRALGDALSEEEINSLVRDVFANIGRTVIELARYRRMGGQGILALADPAPLEIIREALQEGQGVVLATAHFGNWEILAALLAQNGIPIDALALTQSNPKINELVINLRRSMGINILEVPANARQVLRSLKDNRLVLMAADQHSSTGTLVMDFFGRPAGIARGPALFSAKCGCPIVPMLLCRERYDRHVIITGPVIRPPQSGDEEADIATMTAAYLRFLEYHIRRRPEQWLWTHNRWKIRSADGNLEAKQT
jgi:KDO2-lipid IV(A) lauroyltransferase